jgi:division protein CdvB (Snf7/Vps24/ESCRT-III family)
MHELGNRLVVRATKVLVELAQTKLDTAALLQGSVSNAVPKIKEVLNSFSTALTEYTNSKKLAIKNQLMALRAGAGTAV